MKKEFYILEEENKKEKIYNNRKIALNKYYTLLSEGKKVNLFHATWSNLFNQYMYKNIH